MTAMFQVPGGRLNDSRKGMPNLCRRPAVRRRLLRQDPQRAARGRAVMRSPRGSAEAPV